MIKYRITTIFVLLLMASVCFEAYSQRNRSRSRKKTKTERVETPTKPQTTDTVVPPPSKSVAQNRKSLNDPTVVRYILGGFTKGNKLNLVTNSTYDMLSAEQKQNVLNKVAQEFPEHDITVYAEGQQREIWLNTGNDVKLIEQWNNDSLHVERYVPLELKRNGERKVFYYIGGTFNGSDGTYNYSLNLRAGTYLYKNLLDVSLGVNIGGNKMEDSEHEFTGDVGLDSRAYLPFRIKNVNLAPYVGAGVSWSFAPSSYFEWRVLAGACWFIGPGSLDIGLQYGQKSEFAATLGYTFRIPIKKK